MRIMGVDGALASSGVALLNTAANEVEWLVKITTTACKATPNESSRLKQIYGEFTALLVLLTPDVVVMENQHVGKNAKTALGLARARGVMQLACAVLNIPVFTVEPTTVKLAVAKYGKASKEDVQKSIVALYGHDANVQNTLSVIIPTGKNKTDDMADALAIAHTYRADASVATSA